MSVRSRTNEIGRHQSLLFRSSSDMATTGSVNVTTRVNYSRTFFHWALRWFNTDFTEDTSMKPDAPSLICLLQAIGFKLREFEKFGNAESKESKPKEKELRIILECGSSKFKAILEMDDVNCQCPHPDEAKDGSFWSISGTGPTGSMDSINKVEETGSNLLPTVPKEMNEVLRDVSYRLFKMISNTATDVNQNSQSELNCSALHDVGKQVSPDGTEGMTRSYTQPEFNTAKYGSSKYLANPLSKEVNTGFHSKKVAKQQSSRSLSNSDLNSVTTKLASNKTAENVKPVSSNVKTDPRSVSLSTSVRPTLIRRKTWDLDMETENIECEPRPSPPKIASTPVVFNQLCNSLGHISLQSDEESALLEILLKTRDNLERALKMLVRDAPSSNSSIQGQDVFIKPIAVPKGTSSRISPKYDSHPSSNSSLSSRTSLRSISGLQKPTVRRSIGPTLPVEKAGTADLKNAVRRKSFGMSTNTRKLSKHGSGLTKLSFSAASSASSLNERLIVTAKRRISPDPKSNLSQIQKTNTSNNTTVLKTSSKIDKRTLETSKTTGGKASSSKYGFIGKKL
ncbi:uncharacterized protein LOC107269963 [Cephus cinctus]|uniref:Uncharacterized protein LOC107269963 n=1 Tax=Cephus cinctus TaxID=211228 RepID=A0AAJ7C1Y8_CEPCN|nr:uncharacterized protein LOC107269963 [Cephus cinctus]